MTTYKKEIPIDENYLLSYSQRKMPYDLTKLKLELEKNNWHIIFRWSANMTPHLIVWSGIDSFVCSIVYFASTKNYKIFNPYPNNPNVKKYYCDTINATILKLKEIYKEYAKDEYGCPT